MPGRQERNYYPVIGRSMVEMTKRTAAESAKVLPQQRGRVCVCVFRVVGEGDRVLNAVTDKCTVRVQGGPLLKHTAQGSH